MSASSRKDVILKALYVLDTINRAHQLTSWHEDIHISTLPRHEAVYRAIAERDAKRADQAVRTLLMDSRKNYDKKLLVET